MSSVVGDVINYNIAFWFFSSLDDIIYYNLDTTIWPLIYTNIIIRNYIWDKAKNLSYYVTWINCIELSMGWTQINGAHCSTYLLITLLLNPQNDELGPGKNSLYILGIQLMSRSLWSQKSMICMNLSFRVINLISTCTSKCFGIRNIHVVSLLNVDVQYKHNILYARHYDNYIHQ